jgi:hypothetical protein
MMLRDIGSGTLQPDMGLLRAMVHYLDAYPEKRHHPKEDQFLFALLRQRTTEGAEALDRLEEEHTHGNDRIKALEAAVQRYADEVPYAEWAHSGHLRVIPGATADQNVILADLRQILATYRAQNIHRVVALRGDLPSGMGEVGELRYASELVSFIRAEFGDWFWIEVAGYPEYHPQSRSPRHDMDNFVRKVKAGAKGWPVIYFKWLYKEIAGNKLVGPEVALDQNGKLKPGFDKLPGLFYYKVFNHDQCEDLNIIS